MNCFTNEKEGGIAWKSKRAITIKKKMTVIYPIIKVNQPSILDVWEGQELDFLVIRVQDLVSSVTYEYNKVFYDIRQAGSIHGFLNTDKKIILSLVMKDDIIYNFDADRYIEIIKTLKPDFFTTVDGWTYEGEHKISWDEIKRCITQTIKIMQACPDVIPIGQVKGCSKQHLLAHISLLKSFGIKKFLFHLGDYFRNGNPNLMAIGKTYAAYIRKHVDELILYGMSTQKRLTEYSFADGFMTLGYFIKARNGERIVGTNTQREKYSKDLVKNNLSQMIRNIKMLKSQTRLIGGDALWEEAPVLVDQALLEATVPVMAH